MLLHHETLKKYESLGLEVTKIHRGITFEGVSMVKTLHRFEYKIESTSEK